jgi:hypothetical protein
MGLARRLQPGAAQSVIAFASIDSVDETGRRKAHARRDLRLNYAKKVS